MVVLFSDKSRDNIHGKSMARFASRMRGGMNPPSVFEVDENGVEWRRPELTPECPLTPLDEIGYFSFFRAMFDRELSARLCVGRIDVEVIEATNLPAADFGGTSDPYCILELSGKYGEFSKKQREWEDSHRAKGRTHVEPRTLEPKWNTSGLRFQLPRHGSFLKINVFDYDEIASDDPLGHLIIHFNEMLPGVHDGWWKLEEPGKEYEAEPYGEVKSGPAIHLRIEFKLSAFGEFCSFLWSPPPLVPNPLPRFEPNVFGQAMTDFKNKVISNISFVVTTITDAVFWKRGPSYTFTVLALALLFCQHIGSCWMIMHFFFAFFVILTGVFTRAGNQDLKWPALFHRLLDPPPPKTTAAAENTSDGEIDMKSKSMKEDDIMKEKEEKETAGGEKKIFSGLAEITLRRAGRMIGKPMGQAQAGIVSMMKNVAMLEGMLLWQHKDFKMGFKTKDGPMMALGFICGNFFMVFLHMQVELRFIATIGVLMLFSMVFSLPMTNLLPQALKVISTRKKLRKLAAKDKLTNSSEKPAPSRAKRQSRKQLTVLLGRIFHRVDEDKSGSVTVDELLEALKSLEDSKKELIRELVHQADADGSGELNIGEFEQMVLSQGGVIAKPLVMTELRLELEDQHGVRLTKLPSGTQSVFLSMLPFTPSADKQQFARSHVSALRVTKGGMELSYLKRNIKWQIIPKKSIVRMFSSPEQPTIIHLEYTAEGSVSLATISFDTEAEAVCESLIEVLHEVLKISPSSSSSTASPLRFGGGSPADRSASMPRLENSTSYQRPGRTTFSAER